MNAKHIIMSLVCAVALVFSFNHALAAKKPIDTQVVDQVSAESIAAEKIDLNNADTEILTNLPGIGPKTAEKIDAYRQANGPFETVDELMNVKGIGPKLFEKIRPLVKVS